jgi:hypothetical protein
LPEGDVLFYDLECRPTAWIGGDFTGRSATAFACCTLEDPQVYSVVLTRKMTSVAPIIRPIVAEIRKARLSVGHYVRGFDFPLLMADLERIGDPPLGRTLVLDTKIDRLQGIGLSESLGNLAARYEIEHQKEPVTEPMWEEHNLWQTPRSVDWVRERVEGDVLANRELYLAMEAAGRLKTPKAWDPSNSKMPRYRA